MLDLCASGPDRVWAATAAGLCLIESHSIRPVGPPGVPRLLAPAPGGGVHALFPDRLARVTPTSSEWLDLPVDPARQPVAAMAADEAGTLLLGTADGTFALATDGSWIARTGNVAAPPAEGRSIRHRGEIWLATRSRGILRRRIEPRFRHFAMPQARHVNALAATADGAILCGTENGLAILEGGRMTSVTEIDGAALGVVTACAVDREGRIWIGSGSSFRGVYRCDGGVWRHFDAIPAHVHRITMDPTGALWFAALGAEHEPAWTFADGRFQPAPAIAALASSRVYDVVARDPSGVLWFATLGGLAAYDGKGGLVLYSPANSDLRGEKVFCLTAARDGSLWIGYQTERGVSRLARGAFDHFDVGDGLCDGKVWSVVEGRPGVFWFATGGGLSRYDGRRWSCFRDEDGLGDVAIWPLLPEGDDMLWIGTLGAGLVRLRIDDTDAPRTRIAAPAREVSSGAPVTLSWSGTDAWFDTPPDRLWYRWRVDGGRWSAATPRTAITLQLPAGEHRFEVQAIDRFGNAESPPAAVPVRIRGPAVLPWLLAGLAAGLLTLAGFALGRRARRTGS